jgi:hypothetical protein
LLLGVPANRLPASGSRGASCQRDLRGLQPQARRVARGAAGHRTARRFCATGRASGPTSMRFKSSKGSGNSIRLTQRSAVLVARTGFDWAQYASHAGAAEASKASQRAYGARRPNAKPETLKCTTWRSSAERNMYPAGICEAVAPTLAPADSSACTSILVLRWGYSFCRLSGKVLSTAIRLVWQRQSA